MNRKRDTREQSRRRADRRKAARERFAERTAQLEQAIEQAIKANTPPVTEVFDRARGIGAIPENLRERYPDTAPPRSAK